MDSKKWLEDRKKIEEEATAIAEQNLIGKNPLEWYEIESAPMDGRRILVYEEGETYVSKYCIWDKEWQIPRDKDGNRAYDSCYDGELGVATLDPSHWMILPDVPEEVEEVKSERHFD